MSNEAPLTLLFVNTTLIERILSRGLMSRPEERGFEVDAKPWYLSHAPPVAGARWRRRAACFCGRTASG